MWTHQDPSKPTKTHQDPSKTHQDPSKSIKNPPRPIKTHQSILINTQYEIRVDQI